MLSDANTPGQKVQTVRVRPRGSVYRVNAVHVAALWICAALMPALARVRPNEMYGSKLNCKVPADRRASDVTSAVVIASLCSLSPT